LRVPAQQHCNYLADAIRKCYDEKDLIKAAQIEYVSELEKLIEKTENCSEVVKSLTKQKRCTYGNL
jgi:hypothetical protein